MHYQLNNGNLPIRSWADYIEPGALVQATNASNLPFLHSHVAIMPDVHQGYGVPIGCVLALDNAIIPNAVGVDIGCGMLACRLGIKESDILPHLKEICDDIRKLVPTGKGKSSNRYMSQCPTIRNKMPIVFKNFATAEQQLGTLGGGNHFIEIQKDDEGFVWAMIHSGSRGIGHAVGTYYNDLAKSVKADMEHKLPDSWELDYLPFNSELGRQYYNEMSYCVAYAKENRKCMMIDVFTAISGVVGKTGWFQTIDVPHNTATLEAVDGKLLVVHRKGATPAFSDYTGIIPGSQGTKSYIVSGRGNQESFCSCSHGAGRAMSRGEARRKLNLESEMQMLDDQGILHGMRGQFDLDEAPGAYKNIKTVIEAQDDLISIMHELTPLAVIKG